MNLSRFLPSATGNALILLALLMLMVAVFMPPVVMKKAAYNVQITFDISQSMGVEDQLYRGTPIGRLTASKNAARYLLEELPCGSSIGWSIFTGRRVLSLIKPVEVCQHYAGLLTSLDYVDGQMRWANASGVGKGLHQSIRAADEFGRRTTLVFMTDGQEAPPLRAGSRGMPKSDKYDVDGVIVGVGGEVAVRIPKVDDDGSLAGFWQADEVVQRMDETGVQSHEELSRRQDKHLGNLGRLSGLAYLPLISSEALADAVLQNRFATHQLVSVELRWVPASIALLLLCFRFLPYWRTLN